MYGDFSRDSSTAIRNRRVFMQQGRVLLDADFNDQVASLVHTLETLAADLIGPHGGPEESFRVCEQCGSLKAKPGHYYVKGLLCEAAEEKPIETPTKAGYHIVYLDAWERHVTTAEDPSLREPALRGAETASRTRIQYNFEIKDLEKNEFEELLAKRNYPRCNSTPIGPQRQRFHGCSPFGWIAARVVDLLSFPASVSVPISPEQRDGH